MKPMDELVREVMHYYDLEVCESLLLSDKGKKAAWQLRTAQGNKILKKVPGTKARVRFIAEATAFLAEAGVNVPRIEKTKSGDLVAVHQNSCFLLMDWMGGQAPDLKKMSEACAILQALGRFHQASRGFKVTSVDGTRSHLGEWPHSIHQHNERLREFLTTARQRSDSFSRLVTEQAEHFMARAEDTLQKLNNSAYSDWVAKVTAAPNLCHQDFAPRNLRMQPGGTIAVFDMDSVTFDLPARDLRKVFNKLVKKTKAWDANTVRKLAACYQQTHPLSQAEWEVVLLDLWYPHLFYGIVSKYYEGRAPDWSQAKFVKKFDEMVKIERAKEPVLQELFAKGVEG